MSIATDTLLRAATAAADMAANLDAHPDAQRGTEDALQAAFDGIPEDEGARIAKAIGEALEAVAEVTGDYRAWARAWHFMPSLGRRAAVAEFAARLDAWCVQNRPKPERPRRRLAKFALMLLRAGTTGRELLRRLDDANATFTEPLSAEIVGEVAVWAARAVMEDHRHAA
jgi:hypothetical protein